MVNLTYANIIWTIFHKSQETVGCDQQNREGNYETHMLLSDKHVEESSKKGDQIDHMTVGSKTSDSWVWSNIAMGCLTTKDGQIPQLPEPWMLTSWIKNKTIVGFIYWFGETYFERMLWQHASTIIAGLKWKTVVAWVLMIFDTKTLWL